MKPVLIDTSAWIEAIRKNGDSHTRKKVSYALENGTARITEPVLVELFNGSPNKAEKDFLERLKDTVPLLSCDHSVYENAIQIARNARKSGVTVSTVDILIFSVSLTYKTGLLHKDKHFTYLEKVDFHI